MSLVSSLSRMVGPKYMELGRAWAPTLGVFGSATALLGLYFTDWKLVLQYMPYYGGKFKEEKVE